MSSPVNGSGPPRCQRRGGQIQSPRRSGGRIRPPRRQRPTVADLDAEDQAPWPLAAGTGPRRC